MFKVEIELDRQKIINDGIYDYNKMKTALDEAFKKFGIYGTPINETTTIYEGTGQYDTFGNYWCVIGAIERADWILRNLKKLLWYNESSANASEHHIDDILAEIEQEKKYGNKKIYSYI